MYILWVMNKKEYFQITTTLSRRWIVNNTPNFLQNTKDVLFLARQKFYHSFIYDICTEEYKKLYENREKWYNDIDIEFYPLVFNKYNIDLAKTLWWYDRSIGFTEIFIEKSWYNMFGNLLSIYNEDARKILYSLNSE